MIYIIYTNQQRKDAEEILHYLVEEKKLQISSTNENWYALHEDDRIGQESAIILLSNAAVMDERWQKLVRDIHEEMRMIPVSSTKNADYTDPKMVPEKIREVNYIRMDGRQHENIWDCLTTDAEFYGTKNWLLLNKNIWYFSKCLDDFLLADSKKISEYLLMFKKKEKEETNPFFREELLYWQLLLSLFSKRLLITLNILSMLRLLSVLVHMAKWRLSMQSNWWMG